MSRRLNVRIWAPKLKFAMIASPEFLSDYYAPHLRFLGRLPHPNRLEGRIVEQDQKVAVGILLDPAQTLARL